jgi:hypothetical protein
MVPESAGAHHHGRGHHDVELGNFPNTGFIFFKATARNARAMAYWHAARSRFPERATTSSCSTRSSANSCRASACGSSSSTPHSCQLGMQGPQPDRHRAHDLLQGAREQAVRPEASHLGLEALHGAPALGAAGQGGPSKGDAAYTDRREIHQELARFCFDIFFQNNTVCV